MPTSRGGDSRASVRVPIRVPVTLDVGGERVMGWAVNMSLGGMFVECHRQLPRYAQLQLNALIRDGEQAVELHVPARVVHANENGLGVEFVDVDERSAAIIRQAYARFRTPEAA